MRLLADEGVEALFYHGGLKASERTEIQDRFMSGDAEVIVATNAFGMGIDKADVRFVYHYDVSESLDAYYQEIGRAGRDGEKAEAVLLFRQEDVGSLAFRSAEGKLDQKQIQRLADLIADQDGPVEPDQIADQTDLSERKLAAAIHRLEDVGAIRLLPTGEIMLTRNADVEIAAAAAAEEQENRRETKRERLRQVQEYVETNACRREFLLNYFGDCYTPPCNNCDNCEALYPKSSVDPALGTRREVA